MAFVGKGILRSYLVDKKDNERIIQFAPEGWFISDLHSFITTEYSNMNIDAIDEGIQLPPLQRGQRLIFSPVGAYNNTQWLQFIEYRPNVVMVCDDGTVELIREAEDLSDIERRERLPDKVSCKPRK